MLRNWAIIAGMLVSDFCMCVLMLVHVLMRLCVCVGGGGDACMRVCLLVRVHALFRVRVSSTTLR